MGNVADKVKIAQDKDGMLRRALERIIQLYMDKSHFVYELLQNAEDAETTVIKFIQYDDRLEVMHDGRPFTASNLQGLCDIGKSDKIDNLNQIGEFGVGFKSVFGICDTVRLYSKPENYTGKFSVDAEAFAVEILDFTRPEDISDEPMPSGYTTRFVFPYAVGQSFSGFTTIKGLKGTLSKKLQNLGITTLLFMKNLSLIEYQIMTDTITAEGQYLLDKNELNNHYSLVSALSTSGEDNDDECINYLMFTRRIGEGSMRTVDIAFPVAIAKDGTYECLQPKHPYISVYFPTETESKVNFIIQGPFRTTPNRSSIPADDPDNVELANQAAILLRDSLHELRDMGILNMSFIKVLPVNQYSFYNYALFEPLYNTVKDLLSTEEMLPCKAGGYVSARYARISRAKKLSIVVDDTKLTVLIHDGHSYHWLPSYLTETNREYEQVYRFLLNELQISVIRPEDLRNYFNSNPAFLPAQKDDWLVALYQMLENNAAAFSRSRAESNMLTCGIIRTESGQFVAPFRKSDAGKLIPNVFLPSKKVKTKEINFVDRRIYSKCRRFFDDVLQLHEPDEYEFFIQDIKSPMV